MKPSILVIGSINMDLVLQAERIPQAGETFFGQAYQYIPGGKGANQAVALARLGASVTFVGRVGNDTQGLRLREGLGREGIVTDFLKTDQKTQTGLAVIMVEETGQNRILAFAGANMAIQADDLLTAFEKPYQAVTYNLEIDQSIAVETCRIGRKKEIPIILDAGPAHRDSLQGIEHLEILSPNETETYALTGIMVSGSQEAYEAARRLVGACPARYVVIKMGEKGAYLYHDGQGEFFPGHRVRPVDTTAAGDAFTAAMTIEYLQRGDIREAIRFGNLVGALSVTRLGAQPSLPTRREVEAFEQTLCRQQAIDP
ncbi:MAG TPA: ribokinase [Atribacteraceae bacterium]|nr:ribokinase [Atribacteraceae bacterium]